MGAYTYFVLAFVSGVIVGSLFCFFGFPKLMPNHRMQDELTRSKRELATAQRALEEYLLKSTTLFSELDKQYLQYAKFMQEAAERIKNQEGTFLLHSAELEAEEEQNEMHNSPNLVKDTEEVVAPEAVNPEVINPETAGEAEQETQPEEPEAKAAEEGAEPLSGELAAEHKLPELKDQESFSAKQQTGPDEVQLESAVKDVNSDVKPQEKI
ncbi:MAG: DUF1043 family protein [Succinivibrio sp.]|nr:DUF1043 family protein [Succinivibrio sp.]